MDRSQVKDFLCLPSPVKRSIMLLPEAITLPRPLLRMETFSAGVA